MLVYPDGSQCGTLGGGCVEAEVKQRALRVLHTEDKQAQMLSFCLDDNYGWDDGLICGGRMKILADPLATSANDYYRQLRTLVEQGAGCTETVLLEEETELPLGSRYLFDAQGNVVAQTLPGAVPERVLQELVPLAQRPGPYARNGVAYLPVLPRITLLIVGGGHVGLSVAQLAAAVDFDIWVLDDRQAYANAERFPQAQRVLVGDIGTTLQELAPSLDASSYCLIVTRGHNHDEEALYHLAPTQAGYVGMIGSKRKIKLIFADLLARGIDAEGLRRVHAPLGFDIGSRTVMEIAVSIVAELIACRNLGTTELRPKVRVSLEELTT